jgi:hypothetical protein
MIVPGLATLVHACMPHIFVSECPDTVQAGCCCLLHACMEPMCCLDKATCTTSHMHYEYLIIIIFQEGHLIESRGKYL